MEQQKRQHQKLLRERFLHSKLTAVSRLYIACQARQGLGNLEDFFKHENRASPPTLANGDQLRTGQPKSDLLPCIEVPETTVNCPAFEVIVVDAAAVVNMLPPGNSKTFLDYANSVFIPHITNQPVCVKRVDLVWDRYIDNSLKTNTRLVRGTGVSRRVSAGTSLPANWQSFLRKLQIKELAVDSVWSRKIPALSARAFNFNCSNRR